MHSFVYAGFFTRFRYADRCYASFDHLTRRERDSGALILCCVSLFSAYPIICRSEMLELVGKGNYQNYDAHVVPVIPNDVFDPHELNYYPCEPRSLLHPFAGSRASKPMKTTQTLLSAGFTYLELVLFESAQVESCLVLSLYSQVLCRSCRGSLSGLRAVSFLGPCFPAQACLARSTFATTACFRDTLLKVLQVAEYSPSCSSFPRSAPLSTMPKLQRWSVIVCTMQIG